MSINRRKFVQVTASTLATAAGLSATGVNTDSALGGMTAASYRRILGSNEKIRVGLVGFRSRGRALIGAIRGAGGALAAVCDVDQNVVSKFEPDNSNLVRESDFRKLLDRSDLDAIASATPNHWHTLLTMHAVMADKHVYIEKPISHNMLESQMVVKAARKAGKIVQCGFQNRSDQGLLPFYEKLEGGDYGKVTFVHGTCHRSRKSIGKLDKALTIPGQIDYSLWLGPAEDQTLYRPQFHYDWHWDFNTGNGDVGNQGPHEWDLMNWALGNPEELPEYMVAAGNRFGWNDAGNTPNVMACAGRVSGIDFCFEVMDLGTDAGAPFGRGVGIIVETEKGRFVGGRGGGKFTFQDGAEESFRGGDATKTHMGNFFEAIQSNDRSIQRSECAVAANSAAMAHMANISYQLGQPAELVGVEQNFGGEAQLDMISRLERSRVMFAEKQQQDPASEAWVLGPKLTFDSAALRFVGDSAEQANQKMSREYRPNFELPKI